VVVTSDSVVSASVSVVVTSDSVVSASVAPVVSTAEVLSTEESTGSFLLQDESAEIKSDIHSTTAKIKEILFIIM
jgi:hypothetical protein